MNCAYSDKSAARARASLDLDVELDYSYVAIVLLELSRYCSITMQVWLYV